MGAGQSHRLPSAQPLAGGLKFRVGFGAFPQARGEVELIRQPLDHVLLVIHGNTKHHFV
jgi:hypothetical protein